jgi:hypothetical protein
VSFEAVRSELAKTENGISELNEEKSSTRNSQSAGQYLSKFVE